MIKGYLFIKRIGYIFIIFSLLSLASMIYRGLFDYTKLTQFIMATIAGIGIIKQKLYGLYAISILSIYALITICLLGFRQYSATGPDSSHLVIIVTSLLLTTAILSFTIYLFINRNYFKHWTLSILG